MSQNPLSHPERELSLVLNAVSSVQVFEAAVSAGLVADHLTQPPLAAIWTATVGLREAGEDVRGTLMMERLRGLKMDGPARPLLARVKSIPALDEKQAFVDASAIVSAADARAAERELQAALAELRQGSDPRTALNTLKDRAFVVAVEQDRARPRRSNKDILMEVLGEIVDEEKRARPINGVRTNIHQLDVLTSGWQYGKVAIVAARPGGGKTAFATSALTSQIFQHDPSIHPMDPTLFFSLEMDDAELIKRLLIAGAAVSRSEMFFGAMPSGSHLRSIHQVADRINKAPLTIDDETPRTIEQIGAEIFRWHRRQSMRSPKGAKLRLQVIIDYLTRIKRSPGIKTLQDHAQHCMNYAADVAKRTGVALVLLAQLTRGHVKEGRPPEMDDLKGGGEIEENAFHVTLLHPIGKKEDAVAGRLWRGSVAALLEKNRHGPTKTIMLKFEGALYTFRAWDNERDGSLDDVMSSLDGQRAGAGKAPYRQTQKKLGLPPPRGTTSPGED